tara:strand:- start:1035 stop:1169 length:135 start_codon:yes stop_codon:yes gene_type:complete
MKTSEIIALIDDCDKRIKALILTQKIRSLPFRQALMIVKKEMSG